MLEFDTHRHDVTDAVIYARVSSQAQVKAGMGVESQSTYCNQYASWKGYTVHKIFKDSGITGSRADRAGITEMIQFLKANKSQRFVVIVDDISRLARDIRVHLDLRDELNKYSAIMESPSMTFGSDPDGRYFENMQALSAQHHREKNAEQTKKRQQARLIDGYWPFPASLGYAHERISGHGKVMVPKEPVASIIRQALEGYASGHFQTQTEVARWLETQPSFPKTRYDTVTVETVNRILNRVIYAGHVEAPKWNIPLRKAKHEGLISFAMFEKTQERLNDKPKIAVRADIDEDFPLRGFVECADCGNAMTACWSKSKTGKKHPYYLCHKKGCDSKGKSSKRADVEEQFEDMLASLEPSETLVDLVQAMLRKVWGIQTENEAAHKHSLKLKLQEAEKKIEALMDRIVDTDSISVIHAYEKRITKLEHEKLVLREKLEIIPQNKRPFGEVFELAMTFLSNPHKVWQLGKLEHKRTVLKLAFADRLTYCRKTGFRTPVFSNIFNALEDVCLPKKQMAESHS